MEPSYCGSIIACASFGAQTVNVMRGESAEICIKHKQDVHYTVHKNDVFLK